MQSERCKEQHQQVTFRSKVLIGDSNVMSPPLLVTAAGIQAQRNRDRIQAHLPNSPRKAAQGLNCTLL